MFLMNVRESAEETYVAGVGTRESDSRARRAAATIDDVDLTARDVELSTAVGGGNVKSNGLHADEVSEHIKRY